MAIDKGTISMVANSATIQGAQAMMTATQFGSVSGDDDRAEAIQNLGLAVSNLADSVYQLCQALLEAE